MTVKEFKKIIRAVEILTESVGASFEGSKTAFDRITKDFKRTKPTDRAYKALLEHLNKTVYWLEHVDCNITYKSNVAMWFEQLGRPYHQFESLETYNKMHGESCKSWEEVRFAAEVIIIEGTKGAIILAL